MHGNLLQTQDTRVTPETGEEMLSINGGRAVHGGWNTRGRTGERSPAKKRPAGGIKVSRTLLVSRVGRARGGLPDVLSVLQHRQADGALLVGVELLVIQAHLQVLGYSLQRHFNYCRLSCGGASF